MSLGTLMSRPTRLRAGVLLLALVLSACGSTTATTASTSPPASASSSTRGSAASSTAAPAITTNTATTVTAPTGTAAATTDPTITGTATTGTTSNGLSGWLRITSPAADVVTGLAAPWSVAFADGAALISLRDSGQIVELVGSTTREVGVVAGVQHAGEGGLLGLAMLEGSPSYLYAYFTAADDNRIVRYLLTGRPGSFGLGPVEPVFSGIPKANNHNGGRIAFGPDGMLYVTCGDAGNRDAAQDPTALAGKILRLTSTGQVPTDNPIPGNPMYSLGHRNPQGLDWHADGTLWAAEFGQNTWDELNVIRPGANYGWPLVEGIGGDGAFVDPVAVWPTTEASPSGLAVVGDTVFIAALRGQRLWAVSTTDPTRQAAYLTELGRLRHVVAAPDGSLWVLTNNTDGRGSPRDGDDRIVRVQLTTG